MKDLEQRIAEMLARTDPSQRSFQERLIREGEPLRQKLAARKRAFARPEGLLYTAINHVKQAQWRKIPVVIHHQASDGSWKMATLKWTSRGTFHLMHGQRGRWGNGAQIAEDIKHFLEYGVLPPPAPGSWT